MVRVRVKVVMMVKVRARMKMMMRVRARIPQITGSDLI
jgi:hypothetical protein